MSDQTSVGSPDDVGTWLTKAELAHVRRISIASADRLIRRQGWRRQPGNDGRVRVLVPPDWMRPRAGDPTDDETPDPTDEADNSAADPGDMPFGPTDGKLLAGALAALEDAVSALREQVSDANRRADDAETGRREAIALVQQTVGLLTDERGKAVQAEAADAEMAMLREAVEGLRAGISRTTDRAEYAEAEQRRAETRAVRAEASIADLEADVRAKDAELAEHRVAADDARVDAKSAQQTADSLRDRLDGVERDLAVAQHDAQALQEAAAMLQRADADRKARGRLRRAWDGWRGR